MNIIKEILTLPKTNGGKKRRYNLLNQLNIEKRDKIDIIKSIDKGELCIQNNNNQIKTKGQKILSEYYYIDYNKLIVDLEKDQNIRNLATFIVAMTGIDLGNVQTQFSIKVTEDNIYMTEANHSIFKMSIDGIVIYLEDNFVNASGAIDSLQLAIRKYSKFDKNIESGHIPTINNYVSISTIYNNAYGENNFEEIIAPYLITEEEFWAEAKIDF